jgi:hypothetical protein
MHSETPPALAASAWERRLRRWTCGIVAAVLIVQVQGVPPAAADVIDRVLAVVGSHVITLSDAQAAIRVGLIVVGGAPDTIGAALDELIDRQVVLDEVNRYTGIEPDPAAIESGIASLRQRFPSREAFDEALAGTSLTERRLSDFVRDDLRITTYLEQRFEATPATEAEVQRYYRDHPEEFTTAGVLLPFAEVEDVAHELASLERRQAVVGEWKERLRRRAEIKLLYFARR